MAVKGGYQILNMDGNLKYNDAVKILGQAYNNKKRIVVSGLDNYNDFETSFYLNEENNYEGLIPENKTLQLIEGSNGNLDLNVIENKIELPVEKEKKWLEIINKTTSSKSYTLSFSYKNFTNGRLNWNDIKDDVDKPVWLFKITNKKFGTEINENCILSPFCLEPSFSKNNYQYLRTYANIPSSVDTGDIVIENYTDKYLYRIGPFNIGNSSSLSFVINCIDQVGSYERTYKLYYYGEEP